MLSKRERESFATKAASVNSNGKQTLKINLWNNDDRNYAHTNKVGMCLAHDQKLEDYQSKTNFQDCNIQINFCVSTWNRCKEHGPADELS